MDLPHYFKLLRELTNASSKRHVVDVSTSTKFRQSHAGKEALAFSGHQLQRNAVEYPRAVTDQQSRVS